MFDFFVLAQECAPTVHPSTLAAIVQTESQFRPFAIGINDNKSLPSQPKNANEAVAAAKALIAQGHNIDLGLGQINSANLNWLGLSVEDAFDPCVNLAASAHILAQNYMRAHVQTREPQAALQQALSAYNTGSFMKGFGNGYVSRVLNNHQQLISQQYAVPAIAETTNIKKGANISSEKSNVMVYDNDDDEHNVMVFGDTLVDDETSHVMVFGDDPVNTTTQEEPVKLHAEQPTENGT